jgi:hypothetical protein
MTMSASDGIPRRRVLTGTAAAGIVALSLPAPASAESLAEQSGSPTTTTPPPSDGGPAVTATEAGTFTVNW